MAGMFEHIVDEPSGKQCPGCGSTNTHQEWRDPVWEESGYSCNDCHHQWVKG